MMDDIFNGLIMEGVVVVYLDDILIFTETLEEHWRVTQRVMEFLQKHNLFLKPKKCKFEKTKVEYLGVIISQNSVKMDPVKVAGVTEWPTPSNRKEVQSFLGFTQPLPHVHPRVLSLSPSPVQSHTEGHRVEMGSRGAVSIQFTQGTDYNGSDSRLARQLATILD